MATQASYKTLVQSEIDDTSSKLATVINQAIKDVYQEILLYTAKWLVGTTQETQTGSTSVRYVTPTAFMQITDVQWKDAGETDYRQLDPMEEHEYLKKYVNTDTGRPTKWYVNGSKVYFDRIPDTAGTALITYIPVQDELTGDEVSVIPDRFTRVLLMGVIWRVKAYERLPEATEYKKWYKGPFSEQGRIDGELGAMIQELSSNQRSKKLKFWGR